MENDLLKDTVVRTEARAKSNSHRIERLEAETAAISRIATAVELIAHAQKEMNEKLSAVGEKVSALEREPLRRVRELLGYFLAALASLLAGILLTFLTE
jgi:hypothetical protein